MATLPLANPQTQMPPRTLAGSFALPVPLGPRMGLKWMLSAGGLTSWLGIRDSETSDVVLRYLRPGDVFWDAGAGCGYHTLLASREVGDDGAVFAFEAGAERDALRRHLEINQVKNVTVADLDPAWQNTTLDQWSHRAPHRGPRLLRIGAAGAETRILRGALGVIRRYRPVVVLNAHASGTLPPIAAYSACRAVLEAANYRVVAEFSDCPLDPILMVGIPG